MSTQTNYHLLVVDDDSLIIESLKLILPKHWRMTAVNDPKNVDGKMMVHGALVDMHLSGNDKPAEGPKIIEKLNRTNPQIEIIAMSGDLSLELMESCLRAGAQKFLAKPLMPDEVISCLEKIEAMWMMRGLESRGARNQTRWVGAGAAAEEVKKRIASFRGEPGPILIEGETGTGKEVAFRLLNQQEGSRAYVSVNVASISENLFESEMFGHVRGAFTGADTLKVGLAEASHGGDLFLDEIEALSLANQVKLLRFLETGEVRKVGGKDAITVKSRVICATNENLQKLVSEGKFREDLLFRINGKKLLLPPLRERTEDVKELCEFFLNQQKPRINKQFSLEALQSMKNYSWPGNVRELKRICEQLCLTAPLPIIRAEDVDSLLKPSTNVHAGNLDFRMGLAQMVAEFEASVITRCLQINPDIDEACEMLQVSRSTLYKKIKDYKLDINSAGGN